MDNVNNILHHSGIVGMHWGHRRASGWKSVDNSAAKQHVAKVGGKIRKPFIKSQTTKTTSTGPRLTDAQLKSRINRLQMEKTYSQLTKKEMSAGKKIVLDMLTTTAKTTASAYLSKYMTKTLESLMNGKVATPGGSNNGFV